MIVEEYEGLAAKFRKVTGFMAPGKDIPPEMSTKEYEDNRRELWIAFMAGYNYARDTNPYDPNRT